jgi:hypothetical protein
MRFSGIGLAMLCALWPGPGQAACLTALQVVETGSLTLTHGAREERLVFIAVTVDDLLFGDGASLSSAAMLRTGETDIWSLTAYPESWVAQLRQDMCGEDILEAIDAQRLLVAGGDPFTYAMTGLSPAQAAMQGYLLYGRAAEIARDQASAEDQARARLAAFEAALPDRQGTFLVNFRLARADMTDAAAIEAGMAAIMSDPDLDPAGMAAAMERLMLGQPQDLGSCPCAMDVTEAHLFGAGGAPFAGASESWQSPDAGKAGFALQVTQVRADPGQPMQITGQFTGALFAMAPAAESGTDLLGQLGLLDMEKADVPTPVTGRFQVDHVLMGDLMRLPKLF